MNTERRNEKEKLVRENRIRTDIKSIFIIFVQVSRVWCFKASLLQDMRTKILCYLC